MKSQNKLFARMIASCRHFAHLALTLVALGNAPFARGQNDCKVVFDADDRLTATPHHGYVTTTLQGKGAKQVTGEDIFAGGVVYVQVRGAWRKSPMIAEQRQNQQLENRKNARNVSCHLLRNEVVNGEPAEVYSFHAETEDLKSDSLVWISKSKRLILRQEQDLDPGLGDKSHTSTRDEYTNVSAPNISR